MLTNVPRIGDVEVMARLLLDLGAEVDGIGTTTLRVRCPEVTKDEPDPALVGRLRGSVLLLGPLLARRGRARLAPPGGDFPARRTIATHLEALQAMGAADWDGRARAEAPDGLKAASIYLDEASVTGTETALLAAAGAPASPRSATRRPSFVGFDVAAPERAGRAECVRALEEAGAYVSRGHLETVAEVAGTSFDEVVFTGGGAKGALWPQVLADVLGTPVHVPVEKESTALGAALLARVGAGLDADLDEAVARVVRHERTFAPEPAAVARYQELYAGWTELVARALALAEDGLVRPMWRAAGGMTEATTSELERLVERSRLIGADPGSWSTAAATRRPSCASATTSAASATCCGSRAAAPISPPSAATGSRACFSTSCCRCATLEAMSDDEMVAYLARCMVDPAARRPSIETLLHAFLPAAHVDHIHADCDLRAHEPPRGPAYRCRGPG